MLIVIQRQTTYSSPTLPREATGVDRKEEHVESSGSSKVSPKGKKEIVAIGKAIKGSNLAECDGYTDNVGTPASNLKLGLARAKAVCALLKPDVKATKVVSYGEKDPVATNGTAAGRAKNRRVVIKVTN